MRSGCSILRLILYLLLLLLLQLHAQISTDDGYLFAVLGDNQCAESLRYGPAVFADINGTGALYADGSEFYFSTQLSDFLHTQWLQVVTVHNGTELMRILWTFDDKKSLQQRMLSAAADGESVAFRIIEPSGSIRLLEGVWYFSTAAGLSSDIFTAAESQCCFSEQNGAWGAGAGIIDGNDFTPHSFTGQGNFIADDEDDCRRVYVDYEARVYRPGLSRSLLYMIDPAHPTPAPTAQPTSPSSVPSATPTAPSVAPSLEPTKWPTIFPSFLPTEYPSSRPTFREKILTEFAVFNINTAPCDKQNTYYGPASVSSGGRRKARNFVSLRNNYLHSEWVQDVKLRTSGELQFRIIWQFAEQKSLVDRLEDAVAVGEEVQYTVLDGDAADSTVIGTYEGVWRYASGAFEPGTLRKALGDEVGSACCLNVDGAAWGAGSGEVDGSEDPPGDFWGIGDFGSCFKLYRDGAEVDVDALDVVVNDHSQLRRKHEIVEEAELSMSLYVSNAVKVITDDDRIDSVGNAGGRSDTYDGTVLGVDFIYWIPVVIISVLIMIVCCPCCGCYGWTASKSCIHRAFPSQLHPDIAIEADAHIIAVPTPAYHADVVVIDNQIADEIREAESTDAASGTIEATELS